jgi:hypothetical protein
MPEIIIQSAIARFGLQEVENALALVRMMSRSLSGTSWVWLTYPTLRSLSVFAEPQSIIHRWTEP